MAAIIACILWGIDMGRGDMPNLHLVYVNYSLERSLNDGKG